MLGKSAWALESTMQRGDRSCLDVGVTSLTPHPQAWLAAPTGGSGGRGHQRKEHKFKLHRDGRFGGVTVLLLLRELVVDVRERGWVPNMLRRVRHNIL